MDALTRAGGLLHRGAGGGLGRGLISEVLGEIAGGERCREMSSWMRLKHCSVNSKSKRLKQQVQRKDFSMKVLGWDDSCVCVQMFILLFWENQSERYVSWRCIRTVHMLSHLKLLCDAKNRPRRIIIFF